MLKVFLAWRFEVASNAFSRLFYHLAVLRVLALKTVMKTRRNRRLRTRAHNVLFCLLFGHCEWREEYIMHIDACDLFAFSTDVDSR